MYFCRRGIGTITNTGAGWTLKTITTLWANFLNLWTERNSKIHGHDQASQLLHMTRDQVLAMDTDLFIGDTTADLTHYLSIARASTVQN